MDMADVRSEADSEPVPAFSYTAPATAAEQGQEEDSSRHCLLVIRFSASAVPDLSIRLSLDRPSSAVAITASSSSTGYLENTSSRQHPTLPAGATANDLKLLIRPHLPAQLSRNRLRLIYSGRLLPDGAPLKMTLGGVALGINSGPPQDGSGNGKRPDTKRNIHAQIAGEVNELEMKRKGKEKRIETVEDESEEQGTTIYTGTMASASTETRRIYIHCSIGQIPEVCPDASPLQAQSDLLSTVLPSQQFQQPQGFDRLLAPNFTHDDVTNLRTQFRSLLSYTHTPDRMPSRRVQRALEERWLDGNGGSGSGDLAAATAAAATSIEGGGGAEYGSRTTFTTPDTIDHAPSPSLSSSRHHIIDPISNTNEASYGTDINMSLIDSDMPDDTIHNNNNNNDNNNDISNNANQDTESDTSLEDTLLGNVLGFFWPVGALVWGLREENVWTRRRQISVLTGVLLNMAFGFLKMTS